MSYGYTESFREAVSRVLQLSIIYSIIVACVAIAIGLFFAGKKKLGVNVLFACGVLFIALTLGKSIFIDNRLNRDVPGADTGRAEFMLRVGTCIDRVSANYLMKSSIGKQQDVFTEAEKVLNKALKGEPDSVDALSKVIVVEREAGRKDYQKPLEHLLSLKSEHAQQLAKALEKLYHGGEIPLSEASALKTTFVNELPKGWYVDTTLSHLYAQSKQKKALAELDQRIDQSSLEFVLKLAALSLFGLFALIVGVITLFVQLLFVARNKKNQNGEADVARQLVQAPADYGTKTIIAVFVAWLSTELIVGLVAQLVMKSVNPTENLATGATHAPNVVLAAVAMAVLYLVSNAPGMLYAYSFALKPHGIGFMEGLKLRFRVGNNGPFKLILSGLMTWFMAVPLVIAAYAVATQFGSQGSSNPVVGIVMEAAHTGNTLAFFMFYITLGVLAPICEETLFRGFLYSSLRRKMGVFPSVVISAALFAALHLDVGGVLPLFTLGCLFALVFEKTKSIIPSMITHGLWNSGTFTLVLLLFGN
ncbi:MAG: type II CAAX endopeptidase family protein [Candidatus Obscuribacterales bacterium]|nr:type II CAAX endopeptidase family protein [Candidatus Obscuribacterales bacterium]